jgi:hypothetical protein
MASPTRYQRWRQPILNERLGQADEQEPDPDPEDPTNWASSANEGAVQVALLNEIVEPADDFNLTIGTVSNDARNTHNYTSPTLAQDDDDATRALRTGFAFLGAISVGLQSDLGSAQLVSAMTVRYYVNAGATHPTLVEHSPDATSWTTAPGTWTAIGDKRTFVLTTPTSARYWAVRDTSAGGSFPALSMYTWAITGSALVAGDPIWTQAPQANDDDVATSAYSDQPTDAVLRVYLAVDRLIYSVELDIGQETAGATVYELYGTDDPTFATSDLLATLSFTATGSYTLDSVSASWVPTASYGYYQLVYVSGGGDEREFYEIRLFSAVSSGGGVTDHPLLSGRSTADQHPASAISVSDSAGWTTATNVETFLADLAGKTIGYQAHGNLGSTETFDAAIGWHSGTLDANCTFTLTAAPTGTASSLFLELAQNGTGGWTITLPASVVNKADIEGDQITTASETTFLVLVSRDGGTTWYGGWWGQDTGSGGGVDVEDDGTPLSTTATTLNFTGGGVTASGSGATKTIAIPGGGTARTLLGSASKTTDTSITPTTGATATDVATTGSLTCAGSELMIEMSAYSIRADTAAAGRILVVDFWVDGSFVASVRQVRTPAAAAATDAPLDARIYYTPSAGSHTFGFRAHVTAGTGTVLAAASPANAYIRVYE